MPTFTINQYYSAVETFTVEAPDAETAIKWLTEGKPGDLNYPGERDSDEYLGVDGHVVYGDDGNVRLDTWSDGEGKA